MTWVFRYKTIDQVEECCIARILGVFRLPQCGYDSYLMAVLPIVCLMKKGDIISEKRYDGHVLVIEDLKLRRAYEDL